MRFFTETYKEGFPYLMVRSMLDEGFFPVLVVGVSGQTPITIADNMLLEEMNWSAYPGCPKEQLIATLTSALKHIETLDDEWFDDREGLLKMIP